MTVPCEVDTHTVCVIHAVVEHGWVREYTASPLEWPLDDAVDLASGVWGGPLVMIVPDGLVQWAWDGSPDSIITKWSVAIAAFILEEAIAAVDDVKHALQDGTKFHTVSHPTRWRLRDGELLALNSEEWPQWRL